MEQTNMDGMGIAVVPARELAKREEQKRRQSAEDANNKPVITGIVDYVNKHWDLAKRAKEPIERELTRALRQRKGEYPPDKLAEIRKQGGSEIYMMLTSVKCRAASAWLRDALLGTGSDKPWSISPSPVPDMPPEMVQEAGARTGRLYEELAMNGQVMSETDLLLMQELAEASIRKQLDQRAAEAAKDVEKQLEDVLVDGNFLQAFDQFLDDMTTYKAAFIKGPVTIKQQQMEWTADGVKMVDKLKKEYRRVSPFNIYPAPWSTSVNDGFLFEHHELTRSALSDMIGVSGYNDDAIRTILADYDNGVPLRTLDLTTESDATGEENVDLEMNSGLIDALEYWGSVPGRLLVEWGMDAEQIPDLDKEYNANVWKIGEFVIKAVLNRDPMGGKPYYKASYEEIPGSFWGNSIPDIIEDVQNICNAAARALVNNMGIASGPQVWFYSDRLPDGETVTTMMPWKMWQFETSMNGTTEQPIGFFQPPSNAAELMGVYDKFALLADEFSGIPRYMTGQDPGSAGRTASGLSMMIGNASKMIKQVVANVDKMLVTMLKQLHRHLAIIDQMEELRGDINIVARGAISLQMRDAMQVRRNEFLATTANQIDMQIMGGKGRAVLLRENAKLLGLNPDDIVPDPALVELQTKIQDILAQPVDQNGQPIQQGAPAPMAEGQPTEVMQQGGRPMEAQFDRTA